MKIVVLAAVAAYIPLLARGCLDHPTYMRRIQARQLSSSASTSTPIPTASGSAVPSSSVNASASVNASSTLTQISVSLISSNPTAVPLDNITAHESSSPTIPLPSTAVAGATPSALSSAPALPDISNFQASNYPPMDKVPPTDSQEVQEWIAQVNATGISIPNFSPTNDSGACASNPQAAADSSRCWWTCGGCTRDTDITDCPDQLTWGLTYDDGPAFYTPNLLTYLDQQNLKTTFFTIGSRIAEFPHTLQTEYMGGHQIGIHTWSHPPLTTLTNDQIIAEFGWTKKITKDLLGVTPNIFRPPYGDIDDRVRAIAEAMDIRPVMWTRLDATHTFDTGDFTIDAGTISSSQVIENFNEIMGNATKINTGFIVLEHDLFEETVQLATGYILPEALAHQPKFTLEPVITCQKMPMANAYIETNDNSTNPPALSASAGGASSTATSKGSTSGNSAPVAALPAHLVAGSGILGAVLGFGSLLL